MKISVVIATYNGEKYLDSQLQSVLKQTLLPDEIIVCDDCSTDDTLNILEQYQLEGKLKYYKNSANIGVIKNFQRGVSLSKSGNYIALCDQDDEWVPDKLEKSAALLSTFDDPDIPCMVYSDLCLVDNEMNVINPSFWNEVGQQEKYHHNLHTLLFSQFVNGCTTIMNPALRALFDTIPNNVSFHHDDWIAVAAFAFGRVKSLMQPTVNYRKHSNNVTIKKGLKRRSRVRALKEQLIKVLSGKDDFLIVRFELANMFYNAFAAKMAPDVKAYFEYFIALENKSYFTKKFAFKNTVKANLKR